MSDEGKTVNESQPRKSGRLRPILVTVAGGGDEQRAALKAVLSKINELDIQFVGAEGGGKRGERAVILMAILDQANQDGWRRELRTRDANQQFASVVALVSNPSPGSLRAALRAGADDDLGMPPGPEQAFPTLLRM